MYFHIIDKNTAKTLGFKRYFTGQPCVRGSFWERRTSSDHCLCQSCKEAIASKSKEYRARNEEKLKARWVNEKERLKEQHKQWYLRNRSLTLQKKRESRLANPDKFKKKGKETYQRNKTKILEYSQSYRDEKRALINAKASTARAMKCNAVPGWFGELDEFVLIEAYELRELRRSATKIKWSVDHMIPINGFNFCGLHVWNNLQVIPAKLNDNKGNNLVFTQPGEWVEYLCNQTRPH